MTSKAKDLRSLVDVWFYKPAFIWLVLSLIVGIWIRFEWHSPIQSEFAIPHLIHTHTHAALLGWVYLIFSGFTLKTVIPERKATAIAVPMAVGLHLANVGMFIAFSLQGYAFWSILFSSIHLFLTVWLAVVYLFFRKKDAPLLVRNFTGSAWLWLMLSGFGPFALAFTGGMAGQWAQFWLGSYLYLLTNGWILFILIAVGIQYLHVKTDSNKWMNIGFNIMFYSLPGSMISMFYVLDISEKLQWIGWLFNVAFSIGTLMVVIPLIKPALKKTIDKWLVFQGLLFLIVKSVLQIIAFLPFLLYLTSNHHLKVLFLHLFLLGCVTLILIPFASHPPKNKILNALAPVLLLSGVVLMILFMGMMAGLPLFGVFLFLPYQLLMTISGILILAGVIIVSLPR